MRKRVHSLVLPLLAVALVSGCSQGSSDQATQEDSSFWAPLRFDAR